MRRTLMLFLVMNVVTTLTLTSHWPTLSHATRTAKFYVITTWNWRCCGADRYSWDEMVDAWYSEITDQGVSHQETCIQGHCSDAYLPGGKQINGDIVNSQFADKSLVPWGSDSDYLDSADAVLLGWHGSDKNNNYAGTMRLNEPGPGNCKLTQEEMLLGNTSLKFLHLSSCNSMDDNQWLNWWSSFDGCHLITGFHGWTWIGDNHIEDFKNFASEAFDKTLANSWIDNMYIQKVNSGHDQCPVAYVVGANFEDAWHRLTTERYNNVHPNPEDINYWAVTYIKGCDPNNETVITSDLSK